MWLTSKLLPAADALSPATLYELSWKKSIPPSMPMGDCGEEPMGNIAGDGAPKGDIGGDGAPK